jgi:hypothetical protein
VIVLGDFNDDGRLDLAVPSNGDDAVARVSVLLGNGDGTFQLQVPSVVDYVPQSMVAGDFNSDGHLDLAITLSDCCYPSGYEVSMLLGNGDGSFQPQIIYPVQFSPTFPVAGDFDGDGHLDLAFFDPGDFYGKFGIGVTLLTGNGDGTFQPHDTLRFGPSGSGGYSSISASDFNGDGHLDLAALTANKTLSVLLGNGDDTFRPAVSYAVGSGAQAIVSGDFNDDGRVDLAVLNGGDDTVSVLQGNGDGTFRPQVILNTASGGQMVSGDFNGDGHLDLVVVGSSSRTVTVLLGYGDATFTASEDLATARHDTPVAADVQNTGSEDTLLVDGSGQILFRPAVPGQPGTFEPPVVINPGLPSHDIAWVPGTDQGPILASVDAYDDAVSLYGWRDNGFIRLGSLTTGRLPAQVIPADLNGDGWTDLIVRDAGDGTLAVYSGSKFDRSKFFGPINPQFVPPSFLPPIILSVGPGVSDVQAVDTTGTGVLDLVITSQVTGLVSILRNLGRASFAAPEPYRAGAGFYALDTSAASPVVTSLESTAGMAAGRFTIGGSTDLITINPGLKTIGLLSGLGSGRLGDPVVLRSEDPAQVVRVADFNRDGIPDLAILTDKALSLYLGNGKGGFAPPVGYDAGPEPSGLTIADINLDGNPDLLVGNPYGDLLILQGNGDGTFRAYRKADQAVTLAVADLTGDGKPDFVYADQGLDRVVVQYSSDQTKVLGDQTSGLLSPGAVKLADLNGDGIPDLIVANSGSNNVLVYPGLGNGQFGQATNGGHGYFVGTNPTGIAVANLNGQPDLIVANSGSNDVSILLGQGSGSSWTLVPGPRIKTDAGPVAVAVGNILGTGRSDLAVANQEANNVQVFPGVGGGFFSQSATTYAVGQAPSGLFLGNFNGTGTEIAALNSGSNTISLIGQDGVTRTFGAGGVRPSTGFSGDFNGDGISDLVVGNSGDGHLALLLGGADGLSVAQTLFSPDAPSPTSLSFGGLSDGVLSFYVASAGREAALSLAFDLAGGAATAGAPGPTVPGEALSPAGALAQVATGTFQQVAQLLSLNGSSLDLVASLFTVAVVPGGSNGELGVAGPAAGTAELASFLPGGSQGVAQGLGHGLNHDGSGGSEVAAKDEDRPEGELALELVDRLPEWASLGMGLDEAWLKVRDSYREAELVDQARAVPATISSDAEGPGPPSTASDPTPARFAEDPKSKPGRVASADTPGPAALEEVKGIRIEPPSRGVVDAAIEGLAAEPGIGRRSLAPGIELLGGFTRQVPKVHTAVLIAGPIVGLLAAGATIGARRFRRRNRQVSTLPSCPR